MNRLTAAIKIDMRVQVRNNLYVIGLGVAALVAVMLAWLGSAEQLPEVVPSLLLLVIGGTTLLYVGAMILFEKEQGTLNATIVSPLRTSEYLWSKIITLTTLATLEATVMVGGAMLIMSFFDALTLPNILLLLLGIVAIGILYTLTGIILIVRFDKITDYLIPMAALVTVLQFPFLYFWGVIELPIFLIIPTSAPGMLMKGAFVPLSPWEWLYAVGYTAAPLIGLSIWAYRAFQKHVITKVG